MSAPTPARASPPPSSGSPPPESASPPSARAIAPPPPTRRRSSAAVRLFARAVAVALVCAVAACRSYDVDVVVSLPDGFAPDELALSASVYAPGALSVVDGCPAFAYGDAQPDDIASSLVARAALGAGDPLDVPRTGAKLVVVEGRDADGLLAVFGCADVGDVEGPTRVDVALRPTARLVVAAASLAALVPHDGAGVVEPAPAVAVLDVRDRPLPGALVRVRALHASGAATTDVVVADARGVATPSITVPGAGPFLVELDAEAPLDDGPPPLSGFARPTETAAAPFGAALARWALPARMGDGVAYVGALASQRVVVAAATGFDDDGRATFADPVDVGLPDDAYEPVAVVRRPASGTGAFVVRAARDGDLVVLDADGVVATADGATAIGAGTLADLRVAGAFAVGPCVDRDEGPLLLVLRRQGDLLDPAFALLDVDTGAVDVVLGGERAQLRASACIGDPARRALLVDPLARVAGVVDLGDGWVDAADAPDALPESTALLGAVAAGQGRLDDDGATALVATFAGVGAFVDELALDEGGAPTTTRLYPLPTIPSAIGAARATGGPDVDHLFLLTFPGGEDAQGASLHVVAHVGAAGFVAGTADLASCAGVTACRMETGDVDGDGAAEIFVGAVGRRSVDVPAAEVLRLAP